MDYENKRFMHKKNYYFFVKVIRNLSNYFLNYPLSIIAASRSIKEIYLWKIENNNNNN